MLARGTRRLGGSSIHALRAPYLVAWFFPVRCLLIEAIIPAREFLYRDLHRLGPSHGFVPCKISAIELKVTVHERFGRVGRYQEIIYNQHSNVVIEIAA